MDLMDVSCVHYVPFVLVGPGVHGNIFRITIDVPLMVNQKEGNKFETVVGVEVVVFQRFW